MQRHDFLHELAVAHEPDEVVSEELNRRHRADAAWIKRRRMNVTSFHETKHLARVPADVQGSRDKTPAERIQRRHDVGDSAVSVQIAMSVLQCLFGFLPNTRICFLDHLFAEIDADQIVLKDVVVEHVLGGFTEIDDPLSHCRWSDVECHVLCVGRAGGVIVAADAADAAGNEVGVTGIFALHEDAVAAKDRRRAVAFGNFAIREIDFGVNAETSHDASDRVPIHVDQSPRFGWSSL